MGIDWEKTQTTPPLEHLPKTLVREIAEHFLNTGTGVPDHAKRVELGKDRHVLNLLVQRGFTRNICNKFCPAFMAIYYLPPELRARCEDATTWVLRASQALYKAGGAQTFSLVEIADQINRMASEPIGAQTAKLGLLFAPDFPNYFYSNFDYSADAPIKAVTILDNILDFEDLRQAWEEEVARRHPNQVEKLVSPKETFAQRVVRGIDELRKELVEIRQSDRSDEHLQDTKLKTWTNRVYEQLKDWGFLTEAEQGFGRNSSIIMYDGVDKRAKMRDDRLKALRDDIASHPEHYESKLRSPAKPPAGTKAVPKLHKIFLGHGRNKLWARVQIYLKDELKLEAEAWESTARAGLHSVDVLKSLLDSCTFAVIVATGEDATADGGIRARQNVVHEIGLFQGRFGFDKVALLRQEGTEEFSNIAGLQVIPFTGDRIEAAFYELRRMLEREGIIK